ncbi:two-component regulator propeller domain-containing protein [Limisphaera sp. VF-2]|jgi:signal transduction histidine kinase/ligand-binding sensor domain-containing protein|uniref:sensor histidine kinase n=1 Tax=Limisphaera sp. VF-2 TaxID=3400418 RepID=UPI001775C260
MRANQRRYFIIALLLLATTLPALIQRAAVTSPSDSPFLVENWSTGEGLPQSSVLGVLQDRDGYLWLGTLNGLVRFDGLTFTVFDAVNTPELPSSRIVHIYEDRRRQLWIGTETAGIVLARPEGLRNLDVGRGSREGRLRAVAEDQRGAVWLYTADGQLCRYLDGQVHVWQVGADRPSRCRALALEEDRLWVGTDHQLTAIGPLKDIEPPRLPVELVLPVTRLDLLVPSRTGGHWRLTNGRILLCRGNQLVRDLGPYPWRPNAWPSAGCEDAEGNLIIGTLDETSGDGVYWFDAEGRATRLGKAEGLATEGILALCMDREGNLWIGCDGGGLHRVQRKRFRRHILTGGLVAQTVCSDADGNVWMGFTRGLGLHTTNGLQEFGPEHGLVTPYEQNVSALWVDRQQRVWVGTGGGLFRWTGQRFERVAGPPALLTAVAAIHEDRAGRLWFGTQAGLVGWDQGRWRWLRTADGLGADSVRALADDPQGALWIGTIGGGLTRWVSNQTTVYRKTPGGMPGDDVSCLWVDDRGAVWVGTPGQGLACFFQGQWHRFTTQNGLPGNSISYLLEDDAGHLWVGSNAGLLRIPRETLEKLRTGQLRNVTGRVYTRADGLPTGECTQGAQPAAARTPDGRLWFATVQGVVSVHPAELRPNPFPPPVLVESVWLSGEPVWIRSLRNPSLSRLVIPPGRNRLEIHYTSLNLSAPERARFEYRLAGYEDTWTPADGSRLARYPNLPPGQYEFQARAANEDGLWSSVPVTLKVVVQPPFWRTPWFLAAASLSLLAGVAGTVHLISTARLRRQLRQQQALERERARIARDLHDQVGANLVQVALLAELLETDKDQPEEVEAHARQITETARETTRALDEIVWATNPAHDSLEGLVNYLCKYAQEYLALAGLSYRLDVPPLPDVPLAPEVRHNVYLAAKEAIHNVVKHARARSVHLRLRLDNGHILLEIQDDGCGLPPDAAARGRHGLENMRRRLEEIGGRFHIAAAPGGGTRVCLEFTAFPERR